MGAGRTDGLIKGFKAGAAIAPHRYLKFGADDLTVVQAAGPDDAIIGASGELPSAQGEPCDVHLGGIAEVEFGGNVARGDLLTSDADGRAVTAAPGAGANDRTGGMALASGGEGDIAPTLVGPGTVQG